MLTWTSAVSPSDLIFVILFGYILCKPAGIFRLLVPYTFTFLFSTKSNTINPYFQLSYNISQTLLFISHLRINAVFCLDFIFSSKTFVLKYNVYYFEIETGRMKYLFICEVQFNNELKMGCNCDHQLGKILWWLHVFVIESRT